jgi:hypothetical protein
MYDTGVSNLCLDTTFVTKNKLMFKNLKQTEISGVGNSIQQITIVNDKIYFKVDDKYNFSRETYLIGLKDFLGNRIDGILGVNSFSNRSHKIDFIKKKLTFTEKHNGYDSISFSFIDDKIYIPLDYTINEIQYTGKFLLDLGSPMTVLNSTNQIKLFKGADLITIGGVGGVTNRKTFFIDILKLGNYDIKNYPIDLSTDTSGALASTNFDGLIGTDILDDFDIIINLKNKILYIKPNRNFNNHQKFLYKSFYYIEKNTNEGNWLVGYIYLDTDAYKKGLRLNDEILEIDGVSVTDLDRVSFYKNLKLNQQINVKILRGQLVLNIRIILNRFLGES